MKSGSCLKCNTKAVYRSENLMYSHESHYIKLNSGYRPTKIATYLCQRCGYFEQYLTDSRHLNKIRSATSWSRVPPEKDTGI